MISNLNKNIFGKRYKGIMLLSGGMDSAVALAKYLQENKIDPSKVKVLFIDYGQQAVPKEKSSSKKIADYFGTKFKSIELSFFKDFKVPYITGELKDVTREEIEKVISGELEYDFQEWIPARNVVLVSVGSAYCGYHKAKHLVTGFNVEGALAPADNTKTFSGLMSEVISKSIYGSPKLITPLTNLTKNKEDVVKLGMKLGVPFELTWSCYRDKESPCGKCKSCIQREMAFEASGYKDPLLE